MSDGKAVKAVMLREKIRLSLACLGIPAQDYRVLKLLPLIYVAWADGKMEAVKRDRIHAFALRNYELGPCASALLDRWLAAPPSHAYIAEGLHDIYALARGGDALDVDFSMLPALLSYAEGIARSAARSLDEPHAVSPEADLALEEIARELHIDHGESWGKLLDELG